MLSCAYTACLVSKRQQLLFTTHTPVLPPHRPLLKYFLFSEDQKSRNSLYTLVLLVMCILLDTPILGSVLHSIKSNMRDWEVLTAVLLTFKSFWDTRPFRLVIVYGLSEKLYSYHNNGSYSQKKRSNFPELLYFQARWI
jgi:hypothetical protein